MTICNPFEIISLPMMLPRFFIMCHVGEFSATLPPPEPTSL